MRNLKMFLLVIFLLFATLVLSGCSKQDEYQLIKQKAQKQIEYLETELVGILNGLNNINLFKDGVLVSKETWGLEILEKIKEINKWKNWKNFTF